MTNEEKAKELFNSEIGNLDAPDFDREFEIKTALVAMAEWKDQEYNEKFDKATAEAFESFSNPGHFEIDIFKFLLNNCADKKNPNDNIFIGNYFEALSDIYGEPEIYYLYAKWLDLNLGNFGVSERRMWLEPDKFFGEYKTLYDNFLE